MAIKPQMTKPYGVQWAEGSNYSKLKLLLS